MSPLAYQRAERTPVIERKIAPLDAALAAQRAIHGVQTHPVCGRRPKQACVRDNDGITFCQ